MKEKQVDKTNREKEKEKQEQIITPEEPITPIEEKKFLKIDQKNYFIEMSDEDKKYLMNIISSYNKKENKAKTTNEITKIFLDIISPNCDADSILISKNLSKELYKNKKLNKNKIEEYINYFFSLRFELMYSTNFYMNKKTLQYLGYILSYTFSKFHKYNIKDKKELNLLIQKTVEKKIDSLHDYYIYITENNISDNDGNKNKLLYWKKNRNKYFVPPELIFLINRFITITTIEIELDFQRDSIDDEDFKLISIFLLNINFLFVHLEHFKINFINKKFQYEIYTAYFQDLLQTASIKNNIIKKNRIKYPDLLYEKKWNFQYNFNVDELRLVDRDKNKEEINKINWIYDDYNMLYIDKNIEIVKEKQMLNSAIKKHNSSEIDINTNTNIFDQFVFINTPNIDINNKINETNIGNDYYINIIDNNKSLLDLLPILLISLGRLTKINNLDIIMNDSYTEELLTHLINTHNIEEDLLGKDFHILDFIFNKIRDLQNLNLELNSLDAITFNKVLNIIFLNHKLKSMKLSLFSSDVTYFRLSLLKIYNQIYGGAEQLIKIKNVDIESQILKKSLPFFIRNLSVLFEIIKNNKNFEELGLYFDLPKIITNQHRYTNSILKFILNILFLIDSKISKLKKLTILSPSIVLDNQNFKGINDIFASINIYNNNRFLNELNIQLQFYKIVDIKNLITDKLIILNIGDLDLYSFKHLVKYLVSFQFSSKSKLESLGIGLNRTITNFNTEAKISIRELFNIKIENLLQLNLYTNFIINEEKNYKYLLDIMKDNWISSYNITFNSKSYDILNKFKDEENKISFLVPHHLEKKFLNKEKNINNNDIIYWYLKYLFTFKYYNSSTDFITKKKCIDTILKYLYIEKNVTIKHSLEEEKTNTDTNEKE